MTTLNMRSKLSIALLVAAILATGVTVLALAEDKTIILGQEDAATGNPGQDLKTAGKMIKDAYDADQLSRGKFIHYGNWYGPNYWGGGTGPTAPGDKQPIDELDAIAQRHDFAYQIAEEQGKIHGPAEEARLRGIADSIAVRDANALPRNPLEWDPPAPDPDKAHEYRRRIGFGFKYESSAYHFLSYVRAHDSTSDIDMDELDRLAKDRADTWFTGAGVRYLYRAELSAPTDLLEDIGSVNIQVLLHPVLHEGTPHQGGSGRVPDADAAANPPIPTLTLSVSRYGKLDKTNVTPGDTVTLTAKQKLWGLMSNNGTVVTVTASYSGPDVDVVEAQTTFKIAFRTFLEVTATPEIVNSWDSTIDNPCVPVVIRASAQTRGGKAIAGMPLNFARDNGTSEIIKTDESGVATFTAELYKDEVIGEIQTLVPFIVTTAATDVDGTTYLSASRTVTVQLSGEETMAVAGRVVDKVHNDRPIQGASVSMTDPQGTKRSTTTDSTGSFRLTIPLGNESYPHIQGNASAKGFDPGSFTATSDGKHYIVGLYPVEAILIGRIVNDDGGRGIDGSTVHVTAPFDQILNTSGGEFTLTGLYIGDTVTMRADAQNFRAYVKSGKISMASPVVTFRLTEGKGEVSNVLEEKEATDKDKQKTSALPALYSLMVWATPADPATYQNVTITAQIFPPKAGVSIEIQMNGTDDYADSITGSTDAMGRVILSIPGADSGVVDNIVAWIVGTSVKQRLRYSF